MTEFAIGRPQARPTTLVDRIRALTAADAAVGTAALAVAAVPLLVPSGVANMSPADAFIGLAIATSVVWAVRTRHVWRFPFVVATTLYVVGGAIGALAGPVPSAGVVALMQDLAVLFWCWALVNVCSTSRRLQIVLAVWAYSSIAWASVLFVGLLTGSTALTGETARIGARTALTLDDPNYAGSYFFISLAIVWASGRPLRLGPRLAGSALLVTGIVSTGSNSALASLAAGGVAVLLLAVYGRRGGTAALAVLACVAVVGYLGSISLAPVEHWAQGSSYAFLRDGIGRGSSSVAERTTILSESMQLYEAGGVLGQGPNSTKARLLTAQAPYPKEAHDDYLGTLLERGVVGFVGLVLLLGGLLQRAVSSVSRPLSPRFAAAVPHPNVLAGALVGTLVGGAFNQLLHARHVWALFGLVAALSIWGHRWGSEPER